MFEATLCVRSGVILSDYFFIMFSVFNSFLKHNFLLLFPCTGNFFLQLDKIEPFEKKLFFSDRPVFAAKKSVNQEIKNSGLINPFRLLYGYIRTKMVTRCDFRTDISVHRLCDRNMGLLPASKRHFTVSPHEVFT